MDIKYCDICGSEIDPYKYRLKRTYTTSEKAVGTGIAIIHLRYSSLGKPIDICPDCLKKIILEGDHS